MSSITTAVVAAFDIDPEAASMLVDEAVASWMAEEVAKYDVPLQQVFAQFMAGRTAIAKRQLARSYVECMVEGSYPDESVHKTAEWLAGFDAYAGAVLAQAVDSPVDKAINTEWWNREGSTKYQRVVARDEAGKFTRYIDTGATTSPTGVSDRANLSPQLRNKVNDKGNWSSPDVTNEQKVAYGRHQAQWEQAQRYADELASAWNGPTDGVVVRVLYKPRSGGRMEAKDQGIRDVRNRGLGALGINVEEDDIHSISVESTKETSADAVARFNAMGGIGDTGLANLAGVTNADWAGTLATHDYNTPGLGGLWSRMRAGSTVLSAMPGGEKAGAFAALVGQMGPQAETVLGPHVRRTAYRYRGTEKTPDADLRAQYASQEMALLRTIADDQNPKDRAGQPTSTGNAVDQWLPKVKPHKPGGAATGSGMMGRYGSATESPVSGSAQYRAMFGADGTRLKMQVTSDVAAQHLMTTLPRDPLTAKLSEKSGHVLPSQGVLFNDKGEIVSQAVGYADDHYLPFDLKNLASLRGGQYVRTRVQGGLTGEDIYASVQSGARMATVVSTSGVYSIEFDPNFRGARGNSDKARSMYERYLKILDAVESSDLYLNDLTGPEKAKVRERVALTAPQGLTNDEMNKRVQAAMTAERRTRMLLGAGEADKLQTEAAAQAAKEIPGGSKQEVARRTNDIYDELVESARAEGVQPLTLNGEGYAKALETLQQQFPYFIRGVSYEPLKNSGERTGFHEARGMTPPKVVRSAPGASDAGYVRPGGLRPTGVRSGVYQPGSPTVGPKELPAHMRPTPAVEPKTAEESSTGSGGGTGSTAAGGAGAGAGAPPAATPGGALTSKLSLLKGQGEKRAKELAEDLVNVQSAILRRDNDAKDKSWESVKSRTDDKRLQAMVLLQLSSPELTAAVTSDPAAQAALSDAKAVKEAVGQIYVGLNDEIKGWDTEKQNRYGIHSEDEFIDYVSRAARELGDLADLTEPFAGPQPAGEEWMFSPGRKPFALEPYASVGSPRALAAVTGGSGGQRIQKIADDLGYKAGGEYTSTTTVNTAMANGLETLKKLSDASAKIAAQIPTASPDLIDQMMSNEFLLKTAAVDPKVAEAAYGETLDPQAVAPNQTKIRERAQHLQEAWTLIATERALQMLYGGENGGPGPSIPKAGEGLFFRPQSEWPNTVIVKSAPSSPRVRRASPDEPLARTVAVRKALGLPLLRA